MTTSLRIHEMVLELDPEEARLMKQQSRIEEAQKLRAARERQAAAPIVNDTRSRAKS